MNRTKRICSILMLVLLVTTALLTLSACSLADLKSGISLHKDGVYFTVYVFKRYAIAHGFDVKDGAQVYEIPSRVKYKGIRYPVKRFSPSNSDYTYSMYDMVTGGGYAKELIIPETMEELHLNKYNDEQLDLLQKVTVNSENKCFVSIDGVVYTKDKSTLVFYPPAKVNNTLVLPKETTDINDFLGAKTQLSAIAVEEGNTAYSAKDGVLFTADGTEMLCYPLNKSDEIYTIPKEWAVLNTSYFSYHRYLKYLEVEEGNKFYSAYNGDLYSVDGSILLFRPNHDDINVLELPDTIKTVSKGMLTNVKFLFVPKGLQRIVFDRGYYDENDDGPISNVEYLYFEEDDVPFFLRYAKLTKNVKFGVTREQFQAEIEERFNKGDQL